ncbi:MAG: aminotransferase class I/II-fold pyridoxal phosphate-dependent enzyme [Bacilli bacterium]|nr:aminotransferase class I/II-fold pyridoxal phosphate-dependent enzyme [Bacilli bacterium]
MKLTYKNLPVEFLNKELDSLDEELKAYQKMNLHLNMKRGVPCKEQIDLSMEMMNVLNSESDFKCEDGIDCRNYGVLEGIPECRRLLGEIIELPPENIIIFGNSSLNVMFDCITHAFIKGVMGHTPWKELPKVKWLCPVPGYDRHFAICEYFGIEMINIPMDENGPDMDMVEDLVSKDETIKGIWCVPKYSNPTGVTYSEEVVRRFINLKPKAKDFRIYWDNAYSVHHLYSHKQDYLIEIIEEARKANNPDIVYKFTSTSKISFPGSGIAALASSPANLEDIRSYMAVQTIGYDKVNQLRHVRFFKDLNGIKEMMKKHAEILRPKFEKVEEILEKNFLDSDLISFNKPLGGYFISLDCEYHVAREVVAHCKELGVEFTPAGSSFPYHKDPNNKNIRIAPSYPSLEELEKAINVLSLVIKYESIKSLLNK